MSIAIQDCYSPEHSHCFGCGAAHPEGLHLKSYLTSTGHTECRTTPPDLYTGGVPHNLYGGMIAALFDCHGTASAAAFYVESLGQSLSPDTLYRFVTAHLEVDYLTPTPMQSELLIEAMPIEVTDRKCILEMRMSARGKETARAKMVAVRLPR